MKISLPNPFAGLSRAHRLAIAAIMIGALVFRLRGLADRVLWLDEVQLWLHALIGMPYQHGPPLPAWICRFFMAVVQDAGRFAFRLPGALAGSGAVFATYLVMRRFSPAAGLAAAFMAAISPGAIY
jgi:4-amino-4-deoxy-L-arabinose transferase-like glycosyltransferase